MSIGRSFQLGFVAASLLALVVFTAFAILAMIVFDGFFGDRTNVAWYTIAGFVLLGVLIWKIRRHTHFRWLLPVLPLLALIAGPFALSRGSELGMTLYMALIITPLTWALSLRLRHIWQTKPSDSHNIARLIIASAGASIAIWFLQTEGIAGIKDALFDLRNLHYDPDFTSIVLVIIIMMGCIAGLLPVRNSGQTGRMNESNEMTDKPTLEEV